ncbi:MAG: metalloprotease ybeY [Gemmatimonadetes bacterium]|nr:metalloprotease ybeY [Gemmatimonadota bacterium]
MSRIVDVATDGVRISVSRARVAEVADAVLRAERVRYAILSVAFVTDRRIAALNRKHLGHSGPTDVISFGFAPVDARGDVVGDVYIAPNVARRNALAHGRRVREELLRLVVHGVLHVLGHDHPEDDSRYESAMWKRQEQLLRAARTA